MSDRRRPLDLVVSGTDPYLVGAILHELGASTIVLPPEAVIDGIRRTGPRAIAASAVIIDGQGHGGDDGAAVRAAIALAVDLRQQSNATFQPTGTRWKNTPIFIIVRDDGLAVAVNQDRVGVIGLSVMSGWYAIYRAIDDVAFPYECTVLEDMHRLGVRTDEAFGRVIRVGPPVLRRRHGTLPELETDLYCLLADAGLQRGRSPWTARHVALLSPDAVACDFREAEEILSASHHEQKLQNLLQRGAYFLGVTSHELFAHPRIVASIADTEYIPDIGVLHAETGELELDELKTRQRKVFSLGRYPAPSGYLMRDVSQVTTYSSQVRAPENRDQVRGTFGVVPTSVSTRVIAGDTRGISPETLGRIRSLIAGSVAVVGVNDVLDRAIGRLTR